MKIIEEMGLPFFFLGKNFVEKVALVYPVASVGVVVAEALRGGRSLLAVFRFQSVDEQQYRLCDLVDNEVGVFFPGTSAKPFLQGFVVPGFEQKNFIVAGSRGQQGIRQLAKQLWQVVNMSFQLFPEVFHAGSVVTQKQFVPFLF